MLTMLMFAALCVLWGWFYLLQAMNVEYWDTISLCVMRFGGHFSIVALGVGISLPFSPTARRVTKKFFLDRNNIYAALVSVVLVCTFVSIIQALSAVLSSGFIGVVLATEASFGAIFSHLILGRKRPDLRVSCSDAVCYFLSFCGVVVMAISDILKEVESFEYDENSFYIRKSSLTGAFLSSLSMLLVASVCFSMIGVCGGYFAIRSAAAEVRRKRLLDVNSSSAVELGSVGVVDVPEEEQGTENGRIGSGFDVHEVAVDVKGEDAVSSDDDIEQKGGVNLRSSADGALLADETELKTDEPSEPPVSTKELVLIANLRSGLLAFGVLMVALIVFLTQAYTDNRFLYQPVSVLHGETVLETGDVCLAVLRAYDLSTAYASRPALPPSTLCLDWIWVQGRDLTPRAVIPVVLDMMTSVVAWIVYYVLIPTMGGHVSLNAVIVPVIALILGVLFHHEWADAKPMDIVLQLVGTVIIVSFILVPLLKQLNKGGGVH